MTPVNAAARPPGHSWGTMWTYHPELLATPVPRYTSFPTAAEFRDDVGAEALADAIADSRGAISLYVHIPYCEQICWYCGCNTGAANKAHRLAAYLDALDREIDLVAALLPESAEVTRIAFGGGSPNALSPVAFVRLVDHLLTAFSAGQVPISIELDPRGLNDGWTRLLGLVRVSHASLGVQTFDPAIQAAIGRVQPAAMIASATAGLRRAGVRSLNFDLMYGLPGQSVETLEETLEQAVALAPDRIALFGYAHVPHLLPRQRRIDDSALPDQRSRFAMAERGFDLLVRAGYHPVGFDHFAAPFDPLAEAAVTGGLRRNFQGFTDDRADVLIGLGASAISQFPHLIVQNDKNAGRYRMRLSQDRLAGALGIWRSDEDREIGLVIEELLCGYPADVGVLLMSQPGLAEAIDAFEARGLARLSGGILTLSPEGRPYARSLAALFDPYRRQAARQFSTAV